MKECVHSGMQKCLSCPKWRVCSGLEKLSMKVETDSGLRTKESFCCLLSASVSVTADSFIDSGMSGFGMYKMMRLVCVEM